MRGREAALVAIAAVLLGQGALRAGASAEPAGPAPLPCAPEAVGRLPDGRAACGAPGLLAAGESRVLGQPLDLNRASPAELEALPGVGPALAARIVSYREAHGPFGNVADLQDVSGIGPGKVRALTGRVAVRPADLRR